MAKQHYFAEKSNMEIVNIEAGTFRQMNEALEKLVQVVMDIDKGTKPLDEWLDNQDVCLLMDISQSKLNTWRRTGVLPHSRIDRKVYYKKQDIADFIERRLQNKK